MLHRPIETTEVFGKLGGPGPLTWLIRPGCRVAGKSELSGQGLGRPLARFGRGVDVYVSGVRQKLGVARAAPAFIVTVRGKGYQLVKE